MLRLACDRRRSEVTARRPALTSKDPWRLRKELAESIAGEPDLRQLSRMVRGVGDVELEKYVVARLEPGLGDARGGALYLLDYKLEGTIEGAETFLDLRSLAALLHRRRPGPSDQQTI